MHKLCGEFSVGLDGRVIAKRNGEEHFASLRNLGIPVILSGSHAAY